MYTLKISCRAFDFDDKSSRAPYLKLYVYEVIILLLLLIVIMNFKFYRKN